MPNGEKPGRRDGKVDKADGANGIARRSTGQRSEAELSARAAQRLSVLGEMTGGIVHDFRKFSRSSTPVCGWPKRTLATPG